MIKMTSIKIGTRGSALALKQTEMVIKEIKKAFPDIKTETILKDNRGGRLKALQLRMNWIIKKTKSVFLWNIIWIKVNC